MSGRTKKPAQEWPLGSLSPSKPARNYVLPPQDFPMPHVYRTATMQERLVLKKIWTSPERPNSNHSGYRSRGQGC